MRLCWGLVGVGVSICGCGWGYLGVHGWVCQSVSAAGGAAGRCRVPANGLLIYLPDPDAVKVDAEARAELLSMGFPEAQVGGPCSAAAAAMHAGKFGVHLTYHAYRVYRAYHAYRACRARTAWTFIAPPGCAGCCSSGGRA